MFGEALDLARQGNQDHLWEDLDSDSYPSCFHCRLVGLSEEVIVLVALNGNGLFAFASRAPQKVHSTVM